MVTQHSLIFDKILPNGKILIISKFICHIKELYIRIIGGYLSITTYLQSATKQWCSHMLGKECPVGHPSMENNIIYTSKNYIQNH